MNYLTAPGVLDSTPLLVLPLGYPGHRENVDRYFSSPRNYAGICKSVQRIRSADEVDAVLRRAIAALRSGRSGPVMVEVPADLADAPVGSAPEWRPVVAARPGPDSVAIERAVSVLQGAQSPIVVAGQGVLYGRASTQLVALAEAMDLPVSVTLEGKGAFPEDHPLFLGAGGMTKSQVLYDHLEEADVVLAVGASMMTHTMITQVPAGKELVHVSIDASDFDRDYPVAVPIQSDAALALEALLAAWRTGAAATAKRPDPRPRIAEERQRWLAGWEDILHAGSQPIDPYRVVHEISQAFRADTSVVTHDSGSPRDQLVPFYPANEPHSYLGWGKSHALGTGLGLAIGAKLAEPSRYCVALMGDAAFGMTGLDLETAVRLQIPVIAIVNNNGTMAIETQHMARSHELFSTRDLNGDYAAIARALGAEARIVTDPGDLASAFAWAKACNDAGATALLDVRTSPEMTDFSLRGV